jgi:predicted transglutaminase-like protease
LTYTSKNTNAKHINKMKSTTVEIYGVKFDVEGMYHEGSKGSRDEQPMADSFDILNVKIGEYDLCELLHEDILEEIQNKACDNIRESKGRF